MYDSIFDPFGTATDKLSFLNEAYFYEDLMDDHTLIVFELDGKTKIQQRIRFGVWQALGEIGGFYDGLGLIFGTVIRQLAATKFLIEIFTGMQVEKHNKNNQQKSNQKAFVRAIKTSEPGLLTNETNFRVLLDAVKNLKTLKLSLQLATANFCCRLVRKNKGQRLIQKI